MHEHMNIDEYEFVLVSQNCISSHRRNQNFKL